ncbi:MAG: repair protein RecO [Actinomycetota bacterium]|jgi:DNA repair protein RecO (recombination protein O)|nr:repair protein RecO [Actinomycetota bacterium]
MSGLYRDEGVVLRTIKLGEADRIITIFTQGHGKVRAVAKGVRKTTSRFGARLEPASHVALLCYKGRELDVVTQVETIESNRSVREGYAMFTHAVPMLEVVDHVTPERDPNPALYRMLTGALRTLGARRAALVTTAFFWKLLSLEGFQPMLDGCARCGADAVELLAFDLADGGMLCASCAALSGRPVSPAALDLLRRLLGGGLNTALGEPPGPVTREVERLALAAVEYHLERRLRSATLL